MSIHYLTDAGNKYIVLNLRSGKISEIMIDRCQKKEILSNLGSFNKWVVLFYSIIKSF